MWSGMVVACWPFPVLHALHLALRGRVCKGYGKHALTCSTLIASHAARCTHWAESRCIMVVVAALAQTSCARGWGGLGWPLVLFAPYLCWSACPPCAHPLRPLLCAGVVTASPLACPPAEPARGGQHWRAVHPKPPCMRPAPCGHIPQVRAPHACSPLCPCPAVLCRGGGACGTLSAQQQRCATHVEGHVCRAP